MGRSVLGEVVIVGFDSSSSSSWAQRLLWRREDGSVMNQGGSLWGPPPMWPLEDHKSGCCEWERVTCNSTTGHVTHLFLHIIWEIERGWLSLFHAMVFKRFLIWYFQGVKRSWLSLNAIGGWIEHKGRLIYILSVSYISVMTVIYPMLISVSANK